MKRLLCVCAAMFCLLLPSNAAAATHSFAAQGLSLTLSETYTVLTEETASANEQLLQTLGFTPQSFLTYLKDGHYLMIAVDAENQKQIKASVWETEFSKQTGDLSKRDAQERTQLGTAMWGDRSFTIEDVDGQPFFALTSQGEDSGGAYASIQYVTIKNNVYYSLTCTVSGQLDEAALQTAQNVLASVRITDLTGVSGLSVLDVVTTVVLTLVILAAATLAVLIVISFIRDLTGRRQEENDVRKYIKIKRRKF